MNWQELKDLYTKIPDIPQEVIQLIEEKHGSFDKYVQDLYNAIQKLNIVDGQELIQKAKRDNFALVLEVSQAAGLDMIHGNEGKFVTSTHTIAAGALADAGLGVKDIPDGTIVVTKAYASKVGAGDFPTKADENFVKEIRAKFGQKFETGVTTGRMRDLGWFDAVYIRYALQLNGTADLAINCVDLLGKWPGNEAKICIAYRDKKTGELINYVPFKTEDYEPVYHCMPVKWDIDGCTDENQLPENVWKFLANVSYYTGAKIRYIGIGPKSNDFVKISDEGLKKISELTADIANEFELLSEMIEEVTQMSADVGADSNTDDEYGEDEKTTSKYITAEDSERSDRFFVVYQDSDITSGLWIAKSMENIFKEESKGTPQFEDGKYDLPEFPEGREITPGSKWNHFKGTVSTIICIAREAESGDYYVVYHCSGNAGKTNHCDGILARPLENFLSKTDRDKYPDKEKYPQEYRFEKIK